MTRQQSIWVKVCGTTSLRDAQLSVTAGANALGFIFAPSPRQVEVETAKQIVAALGGEVEAIGIFVNESPARVAAIANDAGLSGVQLHGEEAPGQMADFRRELGQRKIIKALLVSSLQSNSDSQLEEYLDAHDSLDAVLLDSGSARQRGGSGVPFDWDEASAIASRIRDSMPLIVAGGLNSGNVARAIELFQPWGIDVVSGVESTPGTKDEIKLRQFMSAVRQHQ
ncbi:MAG TPA: phosphoribosylanthranilate isomerase [Terriglobales bacterium]|jgi:phosphoribosylanthranilate isomerase